LNQILALGEGGRAAEKQTAARGEMEQTGKYSHDDSVASKVIFQPAGLTIVCCYWSLFGFGCCTINFEVDIFYVQ
jgi:hypothetical protein